MDNSRFAFYLIPPFDITHKVAIIHEMLDKQFGFKAAGRFQAHCTIKGFFKKTEDPINLLIEELDHLLDKVEPVDVEINGIVSNQDSLKIDLSRLGGNFNKPFLEFRNMVVEVLYPYIAADCDFVEQDLGNPFSGHITLAFRDCPNEFHGHILSWLAQSTLPNGRFRANTYHFLEFFTNDWSGPWWETITWKLHKTWSLK